MNRVLGFILLFLITIFSSVKAEASDFLVDTYLSGIIEKPNANLEYDYSSVKKVPVKLRIKERISTKDKTIYEGQIIEFELQNNVVYKNKMYAKKGDTVTARIETIVSSGMNGIPYYIYLNNFEVPNLEQSKILSNYHKAGFNRTYLVLPLKWALTFLPPTGSLTNFIMGGHAKIKEKELITIYYYPEWK